MPSSISKYGNSLRLIIDFGRGQVVKIQGNKVTLKCFDQTGRAFAITGNFPEMADIQPNDVLTLFSELELLTEVLVKPAGGFHDNHH
jgi:hypothetical protein